MESEENEARAPLMEEFVAAEQPAPLWLFAWDSCPEATTGSRKGAADKAGDLEQRRLWGQERQSHPQRHLEKSVRLEVGRTRCSEQIRPRLDLRPALESAPPEYFDAARERRDSSSMRT